MINLQKLKLGTKQAIGFGIILVIMAVVNIFSIVKLSNLKGDVDTVTGKWLPSAVGIADISFNASDYRILELSHALTADPSKMQFYEKEMDKLKKDIRDNQQIYEELISFKEESKIYNAYLRKWELYLSLHEKAIELSSNNQKEEAFKLLNGESQKLFVDFNSDLEKLVKISTESAFNSAQHADTTYQLTRDTTVIIFIVTLLMSFLIVFFLVRAVTKPISALSIAADSVAHGNVDIHLDIESEDEIGHLAQSFNEMTDSLREAKRKNETESWIKTGQNQLNTVVRGDHETATLARNVVTFLCKYLHSQMGALYILENDILKLTGSYAFTNRKNLNNEIKIGEGLVGQCAFEREIITVTNLPQDYFRINSGLGDSSPKNILVLPFIFEDELKGVVELASFEDFTEVKINFLKNIAENIAVSFHSAQTSKQIKHLLDESQRQGKELAQQQQALKQTNEELENQAEALRQSESILKAQQEELQAANEELEEKTQYLQQQKSEITAKNEALTAARNDLEQKAQELEITSRYKSEFLANMSHELRTPLNSLLILARSLAENKIGNLNDDQVQSAAIIYKSGNDLLELINDILDLSKIEAGKMNFHFEATNLDTIRQNMFDTFQHVANEKNLNFDITFGENVPLKIFTDGQRLQQVIKNMLSNALKFTSQGGVTVNFYRPKANVDLSRSGLNYQKAIAIAVKDTGIGIPKDKQQLIFEAFQQADGSTSRQFGGTGLGLSISREISKTLGGEIHVESQENSGSTFTIYVPDNLDDLHASEKGVLTTRTEITEKVEKVQKIFQPKINTENVKDDRQQIQKGEACILIVEDDLSFAKILYNQSKEKGFKCLVAHNGEDGLNLAKEYLPSGIILDVKLPVMSGWVVIEQLKANASTQRIPVHMMSIEEYKNDAIQKGAVGFLTKPVKQEDLEHTLNDFEKLTKQNFKNLLIVEDDTNLRKTLAKLLQKGGTEVQEAGTGNEAIKKIQNNTFECVILDLGLPDMSGFDVLENIEKLKISLPPVIVYTGREINKEEEQKLRKYADSIIIKGSKSEERLLDETALFLHKVEKQSSPKKSDKIISSPVEKDDVFKGKKILLVDDDMRNVFALSKILQEKDMVIVKAENGLKAIQKLEQETDINLVLMDIMMPVMDGYEAMKKIRENPLLKKLPIIALTAKAMKEDRDKCIESGASDYMTKPVDVEKLLSLMKVWLYK